ncbi:hypothetical protein K438DRAFT_1904013 [Mycena galopus ATCC 62051]|nr:hypothetical protein K438DRAFT_1904013 [Mycena galopus ATCC 62051]
MALPMLVNNADCGPSNGLQGLSKRFDQDRGLQQDHFGSANRAGSSRETFRSQTSTPNGGAAHLEDAARFFSAGQPAPQFGGAFDLSALHGSLPPTQMQGAFQQQQPAPPVAAAWAADFMQHSQPGSGGLQKGSHVQVEREMNSAGVSAAQQQQQQQWGPSPMFSPFASQGPMQNYVPPMQMHMTQQQPQQPTRSNTIVVLPHIPRHEILWDREFETLLAVTPTTATQLETPQVQAAPQIDAGQVAQEADELARTAGLLLETRVSGLMRGLRDREVVVEGNEVVPNTGQQAGCQRKGRAMDPVPIGGMLESDRPRKLVSFAADVARERLGELRQEDRQQTPEEQMLGEDPNDAYFRQENADTNAQSNEWGHLQADWDAFEATSTGIHPVVQYEFQRKIQRTRARGGGATQHDRRLCVVDLGVKQQANEREKQALQALTRAVELDPNYLAAWLALAWVDRNARYKTAVAHYRAAHPDVADASITERFASLIQCLIEMARSELGEAIDADIQIALAVLLNTNEDYAKAQDCFRTALAVRPDDWLLYNRVGATMANSGRAEEALQYYLRALELNPMYIRARFNLGISCINLRRFEDAARHILDALGLQESDGVSYSADTNTSGVTTTALWDSLRTACMHMQRPDLASFCDRQDLEGFRKSFLE